MTDTEMRHMVRNSTVNHHLATFLINNTPDIRAIRTTLKPTTSRLRPTPRMPTHRTRIRTAITGNTKRSHRHSSSRLPTKPITLATTPKAAPNTSPTNKVVECTAKATPTPAAHTVTTPTPTPRTSGNGLHGRSPLETDTDESEERTQRM